MVSSSKSSGVPIVAPTRGQQANAVASDLHSDSGSARWGQGGKDGKGKGKASRNTDGKGEGSKSRGSDDDWQEDFYRPAFVQDPWEELYAQHPAASHLRAHLDLERDTQKEVEMEEEKALAALEAASAKETLDARLQALGLQKAAAVATELAEKAAASAEAAAIAKAKDEPKATSIYDFFEDGDDLCGNFA